MTTSFLRSAVALVVGVAMLAGCGGSDARDQAASGATLDRLRHERVVRIGYANEAPFGYQDTQSGRVTGEAPEIARVIFERMGVQRVEATLTDFGQLIPGLQAGRYDVIAAGMYITPERCRQIRFSNPSYAIGTGFLVARDNPKGLHSFEEVRDHPDARLGVVGGAVEVGIAEQVGVPENRIVVFPDNSAALAGLNAGRIDAFAGTALTVQDLLRKAGGERLERAEPFTQPTVAGGARNYGAFGFRLNDADLVEAFNRHLASFIGTPEHLELVEPFGFTREELPGDVTAEDICAPPAAASAAGV